MGTKISIRLFLLPSSSYDAKEFYIKYNCDVQRAQSSANIKHRSCFSEIEYLIML